MNESKKSVVDGYLLDNSYNKIRPEGCLYVTDLIKPCLRSSYYGIIYEKEYPIETQRIFESGRMIENWWVNVLRSLSGIYVLGTNVKARYVADGLEVHGRVDALCQHNGGKLVAHEVKSSKSLYYTKEPKVSHVEQLQFYLAILGLEVGQVDYLDKSVMLQGGEPGNGERVDKCFRVRRDSRVFADLLERARVLTDSWVKEEPPPKSVCWLCDYCLFSEVCKEEAEK